VHDFEGLIQKIENAVYTGKGREPCHMGRDVSQLVKETEKEIR